MGGDQAPAVPVAAALDAVTDQRLHLMLIGDEDQISPHVEPGSFPADHIEIIHAPERVSMEDEAVSAVRKKRRASIPVGLELVREGHADVFLSAGNTGAVVASAVVSLGRLRGVHRPGIAIPLPTLSGDPLYLIDAGALVDPRPEYLWQHARLASTYVRTLEGIPQPRIGLVSNGEESSKGNSLTREAFKLLSEDSGLQFIGNVEPRDIGQRPCDVLVCDGFTGNIILKTAEGIVSLMQDALRAEFRNRWYTGLLATLLKPAFRRAGKSLDYREYGGAPLLGVDGLVMISHGSSDRMALTNAIRGAGNVARQEMLAALRSAFPDSG
jgi:phosphate acyltransferase